MATHLNGRTAHDHEHRHTREELDADPWHHGGAVKHAHNHCNAPEHVCTHHDDDAQHDQHVPAGVEQQHPA